MRQGKNNNGYTCWIRIWFRKIKAKIDHFNLQGTWLLPKNFTEIFLKFHWNFLKISWFQTFGTSNSIFFLNICNISLICLLNSLRFAQLSGFSWICLQASQINILQFSLEFSFKFALSFPTFFNFLQLPLYYHFILITSIQIL